MRVEVPVLEVRSLSKAYRRRSILRDVSLSVLPGEAVAIIGANGAGKSTFLGCITGERLPDSGEIRMCGASPLTAPSEAAACMGYVPEHPFLYGELTVGEILRFVAEIRRLDRSAAEIETERLLGIFGLAGAEGALCRELSQGMARKVAIVTALLHRPRLLVLDEVFNGLDVPSIENLLAELMARRREGSAVLLSSHDLQLLARWCDRGLLLAPDASVVLDNDSWRRWTVRPGFAPSDPA